MSKGARFTLEQISRMPERIQTQIYAPRPLANHREAPPAIVERGEQDEPLEADQAKEGDSGKYLVRVTSHRVHLLDEDNLCEKYHIDALRYSGILPSDAPDRTRIITTQKKVAQKSDQFTEITIERTP